MRKIELCCVCLLLTIALSSCTSGFEEREFLDIPIQVHDNTSNSINIEVIFSQSFENVKGVLNNAKFQSIVFSSECSNLESLKGEIVLTFAEWNAGILRPKVHGAIAIIDTDDATMDVFYRNEENYYLTNSSNVLPSTEDIRRDFKVASDYIRTLNIPNCQVTITQNPNWWDVRCGPKPTFEQKCRFRVNNEEIFNHIVEDEFDVILPP